MRKIVAVIGLISSAFGMFYALGFFLTNLLLSFSLGLFASIITGICVNSLMTSKDRNKSEVGK